MEGNYKSSGYDYHNKKNKQKEVLIMKDKKVLEEQQAFLKVKLEIQTEIMLDAQMQLLRYPSSEAKEYYLYTCGRVDLLKEVVQELSY